MEAETIFKRMERIAKNNNPLKRGKAKEIWDEFIEILKIYSQGLHEDAFRRFYSIFLANKDNFRFETLKKDSDLFRIRIGHNPYEEFSSYKELFHISFENCHLVGNERFSVSGFPSLYLGSSIYVCWEETGRPNWDYATMALFKTQEDMLVLDLTEKKRLHFTDGRFQDCLILACSIKVQYPESPFKPEYIIPQLLLQSIVKFNKENSNETISGVKYTSSHIDDDSLWIDFPKDRHNIDKFSNYVFPPCDSEWHETGISNILHKNFQLYNCITYNKFKFKYPKWYDEYLESCREKVDEVPSVYEQIELFLKKFPSCDMLKFKDSSGALTC